MWVRGCQLHFLRWTVVVASIGADTFYEVDVKDCPDHIHHWYDHFYCPRPCLEERGNHPGNAWMNEVTQLTRVWGRALDANLRYTALLSELAGRSLELLLSAVSEIGPQIITTTDAVQEASRVTSIPPAPGAFARRHGA